MVNVYKCDRCGAIMSHQEAVHQEIYGLTSTHYKTDLCPECAEEFKKFLGVKHGSDNS